MKILPSALAGAYVIEPELLEDERGFFARTYCRDEFAKYFLNSDIAQCSISFNIRTGTLRGMHFQTQPHEEIKVVRCTMGVIYDVIVDLRPASLNFRRWFAVELSAQNRKMLYIPEGFAHGFQTLVENTEVFYQISQSYVPGSAQGIRWNDPALAISWPLPNPFISERDGNFPLLPPAPSAPQQ